MQGRIKPFITCFHTSKGSPNIGCIEFMKNLNLVYSVNLIMGEVIERFFISCLYAFRNIDSWEAFCVKKLHKLSRVKLGKIR